MKVVLPPKRRPLPNHLADLLRTCRERNTTETKALSAQLNLSTATVNAYFQRAADALGTTDRYSSVQQASRLGLLDRRDENLLINGDFVEGNRSESPGTSLPWATVTGWHTSSQTPQWVMPESDGGPGAMMMWGAADTGEGIYQRLPPMKRLKPGHVYRFSAEYRFGPVRRDWPLTSRQPMFVDFVVRASIGPIPSYTTPDEPGQIATIGRLHYAPREPEAMLAPPPVSEGHLQSVQSKGGKHSVRDALYTERAGGYSLWAWESDTIEDWVADALYDTISIHPTNDQVVGTGGINPDAPNEIAWGQIRRVRLVDVEA
jgi:hypothetical protein